MFFNDDGYVGAWWGDASWDAPSSRENEWETAAFHIMDGDDFAVSPAAPVHAIKAESMDAEARARQSFEDRAKALLECALAGVEFPGYVAVDFRRGGYRVMVCAEGNVMKDRPICFEGGYGEGEWESRRIPVSLPVVRVEYAGLAGIGPQACVSVTVGTEKAEQIARRAVGACARICGLAA